MVDTNVVLHQVGRFEEFDTLQLADPRPSIQIDLLQSLPASIPLLIPSTTLSETRHRSLPIYNRFQQLIGDEDRIVWVYWNESSRGSATAARDVSEIVDEDGMHVEKIIQETSNDRNDRAIRQTIHFYDTHLSSLAPPSPGSKHPVLVLLTDDRGNRVKAKEQGLHATSVKEYVAGMTDVSERERLADLVARTGFEMDEEGEGAKVDTEIEGENKRKLYENVSLRSVR